MDQFSYLGGKLTSNYRRKEYIKSRLAQERKASKGRFVDIIIWIQYSEIILKSTGLESGFVWQWKLFDYICQGEKKKIEISEMSCYRRMFKIGWFDKVTNGNGSKSIGENQSFWRHQIKSRDRLPDMKTYLETWRAC